MNNNKDNREKIKEVYELMQKYPDYPVKIFVSNDTLLADYAFTAQDISIVKVGEWIETDDYIFGDYDNYIFDDYDDYIEHLTDYLELFESYEEAEKANPLDKIQKAIVIKMNI